MSISYPPLLPLVLVSIRWWRSDASTVSGRGIVGSIYHPFQLAAPKQCGLINKRWGLWKGVVMPASCNYTVPRPQPTNPYIQWVLGALAVGCRNIKSSSELAR